MARLLRPWGTSRSHVGDCIVLGFLLVQALDGSLTYLGVRLWGPSIEGNPLVSSAMAYAGLGVGLAGAKLFATTFGIVLHLKRMHGMVALLTALYLAAAILPWAIVLMN